MLECRLDGVVDTSLLPEATPIRIDFVEHGRALPARLGGVVWRHAAEGTCGRVAVERLIDRLPIYLKAVRVDLESFEAERGD